MIVVNGKITASAADIDKIRAAVAAMEDASRAEDGCHDYTFSVEMSDPNVVRITELWENMDALAAHFVTPHMAEFQQAIKNLNATGTDVKFFEAAEVSPPGR